MSIFSIGHGSRSIESFLGLLKTYGIRYVADVRSNPYSRYHQQYNQSSLKQSLKKEHIQYLPMGDTLGGRPKDMTVYDRDGKLRFDLLKQKPYYREGINFLITASSSHMMLAMLCAEKDPKECHRSRLIATSLLEAGIDVQHIDADGKLISEWQLTLALGSYNTNLLF